MRGITRDKDMKKAIETNGAEAEQALELEALTRRAALSWVTQGAAGLAALGPLALLTGEAAAQNYGRFPAVDAENIRGQSLRLPNDLPGRLLIVSVALSPRRQREMVSWADQLSTLANSRTGVEFYEVVVAGRRGALERFLIDKNISSATRDNEARLRTFTVYEAEARFRREMNLPNDDGVYVFVMTSNGLILDRASGRATPKKLLDLRQSIDRAIQGGRFSKAVL